MQLGVLLFVCPLLSCSAGLQVSPDRSQFFMYDTVSLDCGYSTNSSSWKVKRRTSEGGVRPCSSGWGSTSLGSACIIGNIYPSDSGLYWCESAGGERSSSINISVTDGSVILETPTLPVLEGAAVTLTCIDKLSLGRVFSFFKDGRSIGSSSTGQKSIRGVSRSDEGLYRCSVSGGGESLPSWVAVDASCLNSSSCPPAAVNPPSVSRLTSHLVVGTPYLLSTILLGLMCRDKRRAARSSSDVIMEIEA